MRVGSIGGRNIDRDLIGVRGEQIAQLALTEPVDGIDTLFRPVFLGDKYPAVDLIVELEHAPGPMTPFFFVQVKATRSGYNQAGNLRVRVVSDTMDKLVAYPVPTYIIGVDSASKEIPYIVAAVAGGPAQYRSFPTSHQLNGPTLRRLYDEVLGFWRVHGAMFATSDFV